MYKDVCLSSILEKVIQNRGSLCKMCRNLRRPQRMIAPPLVIEHLVHTPVKKTSCTVVQFSVSLALLSATTTYVCLLYFQLKP